MAAAVKNTTSSDTSENDEDDETPWAVHIRDLKRRREEIESGGDEVLNERLAEYERERTRRKKEAKMHRNYQIKYSEALYAAQERAADDLYNEAKGTIQSEMLNAINDDIYRYTGRREGEEEGAIRVSARNLRSKAVAAEEEAAKAKKKSKYGNGEDAPIDFALKHKDIVKDLKQIHNHWKEQSDKFHEILTDLQTASVRVEHGHLHVKRSDEEDYVVFYPGVRVKLTSEFTGEPFQGTLTSVNAIEVYIRLLDDSKTRVYLKHIRNGRVSIEIFPFAGERKKEDK